jgi:serine/threonine-protein kinase RsbW
MGCELTRLELPAEISSLHSFTDFLRRGGEAAALQERELGQLDLVIEEILVNVMHHAYPEGNPGTIEVAYAVEPDRKLFVQISDTGRPFDPLAKDPPNLGLSLAERTVGGLGIFLVKQFANTVEYRRVENRNILSFRLGKTP